MKYEALRLWREKEPPDIHDATLTLYRGEVLGLFTQNSKELNAYLKLLARIISQERQLREKSGKDPADRFFFMMHDFQMMQQLTVAENLFIGGNGGHLLSFMNYAEIQNKAARLLRQYGLSHIDAKQRVQQLSILDVCRLAVLCAVVSGTEILVVENVMSCLSQVDMEQFALFLRKVSRRGISVLYLADTYHQPMLFFDRIAISQSGIIEIVLDRNRFTHDLVVQLMMDKTKPKQRHFIANGAKKSEDILITISELRDHEDMNEATFCFSMEINRGGTAGILEVEGDATRQIFDVVSGKIPGWGEVDLHDKNILQIAPHKRNKHLGIIADGSHAPLVFEDLSIIDNLTISMEDKYYRRGRILNKKILKYLSKEAIRFLGIERLEKAFDLNEDIVTLEAASRFAIAVCRTILSGTKFVVIQNPERSFNENNIHEFYSIIEKLRDSEITIFIISKNADIIQNSCVDYYLMRNGRISSS